MRFLEQKLVGAGILNSQFALQLGKKRAKDDNFKQGVSQFICFLNQQLLKSQKHATKKII
jgi:hypothetical protein